MIVLFVTCLIASISFVMAYCYLNAVKITFSLKLIMLFSIGVLMITLINYYNVSLIKPIVFLIYFPTIYYCIKPQKILTMLRQTILIWLMGILIDLIVVLIVDALYYFFDINLVTNIISECITSLLMAIFLIIIFKYNKFILKAKYIILNFSRKKIYDIILIVLVFICFFFGALLFLNSLLGSFHTAIQYALIIVLLMTTIFSIISKIYLKDIYYNNMRIFKENTEFYNQVKTEYDIFRHNLVNKLNVLRTVANDRTNVLIDELIGTVNHRCDVDLVNVPYELSGIISQKFYDAKDLKVNIDNLYERDILDVLKPKYYSSFIESIGVLLDNAIDAASKSTDKIIDICFYESEEEFMVDITNSFDTYDMDIDSLGLLHYSTKNSKRGLGLFSVLKNNYINVEYNIVNNLFIAKVKVKK